MEYKGKKILLIGSGAIQIGQAGEFDYSGSQAIKALKEEGVQVILINPNIATIQTSKGLADKIYFLPVDEYFTEKVIEKENPDGVLLGFGGQTALNVGLSLYKKGIFEKYNVKILGTDVEAIIKTEDRAIFNQEVLKAGYKVPVSGAVETVDAAIEKAREIGYPVMVRIAYALGGLGSGIVETEKDLRQMATKALNHAPQILVEECLIGWKELEYEVVRDNHDNCIVVCSMENFDPMGIHTGESIVTAPIQTLSAKEVYKLREIAIHTIRALKIIGECNIQFAFSPNSDDYRIIEVNPRLSRSSALASKATGYPLAYIAAKLALGYNLTEIRNNVTGITSACFEPALDYCVIKIPRWDLTKFKDVYPVLGSEMKSVGEIMSIGRTFEETFQKAMRMLDIGVEGVIDDRFESDDIDFYIKNATEKRVIAITKALKEGYSIEQIHELSHITPWFLQRLENIVRLREKNKKLSFKSLKENDFRALKRYGFSDTFIAQDMGVSEAEVRNKRKSFGVVPVIKKIDTLAAEFPAKTNYLYLTYSGEKSDFESSEQPVIVLGSGTYRIGCSVEFDWCCVSSINALKNMNYKSIMINYNPETVSTDYDISDKLYFEELSYERVLDICEAESPKGVIVSMGGQLANNIALPLSKSGVNILGTPPTQIDQAEDRNKFSQMLDNLGIDQPEWAELTSTDKAKAFAKKVGYPVLIRPSYVLSGAAMSIALNEEELLIYLQRASAINNDHPVVISKFINNSREVDVDAVAQNGTVVALSVSLHLENAGVHSGDATLILPPNNLYLGTIKKIEKITEKIAKHLNITGPFNIQYIARRGNIKVIECNLRASRSFPFVSKVFKENFITLATKAIMGQRVQKIEKNIYNLEHTGVKASQFSFTRLKGSDPVQTVEMTSTGEVGCLGDTFHEAFLKSLISVGMKIPEKTILLSTGNIGSKLKLLDSCQLLREKGLKLFGTKGTAKFLNENGVETTKVYWPNEMERAPNAISMIKNGAIDLVINIPKSADKEELENDYIIRRTAVDFNVPLITNVEFANQFVQMMMNYNIKDLKIKSYEEY